jgi:hypothetical protein
MRLFAGHIAGDYAAVAASVESRRLRESAWSERLTSYGLKAPPQKGKKLGHKYGHKNSHLEIQDEIERLARARAVNLCDNTGIIINFFF